MAILISNKGSFRAKNITKQGETFHNDKRANAPRHGDSKCVHTKNRTIQYVKQKLTELIGEIEKYTITGKDFTTPLSIVDRVTRESINRI